MILVDATGNSKTRFHTIDDALISLIYGSNTSVWINREAANGVFTYTVDKLEKISEGAKYHFPVTVLRLPHCDTAEDVRQIAIKNGGIVVVDEAQHIDRIPGAAEALKALESPYIKFVYVALVDKPEGIMARFKSFVGGA